MTAANESIKRERPGGPALRGRLLMVAAVAAVMLLVLVIPFPVGGWLWSQLFDLAHAPAFCFLLLAVAGFIDPGSIGLSPRFSVLREVRSGETTVLAGCCLMLGCVGEFLQAFAGRSPSAADLMANGAGVVSGVLWIQSRRAVRPQRIMLTTASLVILVVALIRPVSGIRGAVLQRLDFPLLASFERSVDLGAWVGHHASLRRTDEWASDGQSSLQVELFPGRFSGIEMIWPARDWRGYDRLHCDLRNPSSTPLTLTLKIFDRQHREGGFDPADRFESSFVIPAAATYELTVDLKQVAGGPDTRPLNLAEIAGVELFAVEPPAARTLLLDHLRLVKDAPAD